VRRDGLSQWEFHSYFISIILKIRLLEEICFLAKKYQSKPTTEVKERMAKLMTVLHN
jgi:hypothetical protein